MKMHEFINHCKIKKVYFQTENLPKNDQIYVNNIHGKLRSLNKILNI
jgi:hypothetical protein